MDVFRELGEAVARVAEITPGGVLIFFPSYRILETTYEQWQFYDIESQIERHKALLREPKDPALY